MSRIKQGSVGHKTKEKHQLESDMHMGGDLDVGDTHVGVPDDPEEQ